MSYFFISKQPYKANLVRYTALNVDKGAESPYIHIVCKQEEKDKHLSFGSLFEIDLHGKWKELRKYDEHDYEMCVVLDKIDDELLFVYGNAIHQKRICIDATKFDIKPGNKILIKPTDRINWNFGTVYCVVHNITHAMMIREMNDLIK